MGGISRFYTDEEIWLEQQMKALWEWSRGSYGASVDKLLQFWSADTDRLDKLQRSSFSDDWISLLVRGATLLANSDVSYLCL